MQAKAPRRPDRPFYGRAAARLAAGLVTALASLFVLVMIGRLVDDAAVREFDEVVRDRIHRSASPELTAAVHLVTALGSTLFWAPATAALVAAFFGAGWPRAAGLLVATMAGSATLNFGLKLTYQRARPSPFFGLPMPDTYSFPSGHALDSLCFYGILAAIVSPRISSCTLRVLLWCCAIAVAGAVGISRIYLGVHYPSDVLAGYAAALVWIAAVMSTDRYLQARLRPERTQPQERFGSPSGW
jgi:undecaprenyl-diphosphatase